MGESPQREPDSADQSLIEAGDDFATEAAPLKARRRGRRDEPLTVKIEFVVVEGRAGVELARRQAAAMRSVLQWLHDHPLAASEDREAKLDGPGARSAKLAARRSTERAARSRSAGVADL